MDAIAGLAIVKSLNERKRIEIAHEATRLANACCSDLLSARTYAVRAAD